MRQNPSIDILLPSNGTHGFYPITISFSVIDQCQNRCSYSRYASVPSAEIVLHSMQMYLFNWLMPRLHYFLKTSSYESEALLADKATVHSGNPSPSYHLRSLVNECHETIRLSLAWLPLDTDCAPVQFAA